MIDMDEMLKAVRAYPFHDYRVAFPFEILPISEYYANVFKNRYVLPEKSCFSIENPGGDPPGVISVNSLEWDSEFFKIPMASIEDFYISPHKKEVGRTLLERAIRFATDQELIHLSAKVNTRDIFTSNLLEAAGFKYMDTILYYVLDLKKPPERRQAGRQKIEIHPLREEQKQEVLNVASRAFSRYRGRFQYDRTMPDHEASGFYVKWLKSSMGDKGQDIFVGTSENSLTSFAVWKHDTLFREYTGKNVVTLALIGVSPESSGAGIAAELIEFATLYFNEAEYFIIPVHINNIGMQRSAVRTGARLASSRNTFHMSLS